MLCICVLATVIDSCCETGDGLISQGLVLGGGYLCASVGWQYASTLRESCHLALVCSCPNLVFASPTKMWTGVPGDCDRQQVPLIPPPA